MRLCYSVSGDYISCVVHISESALQTCTISLSLSLCLSLPTNYIYIIHQLYSAHLPVSSLDEHYTSLALSLSLSLHSIRALQCTRVDYISCMIHIFELALQTCIICHQLSLSLSPRHPSYTYISYISCMAHICTSALQTCTISHTLSLSPLTLCVPNTRADNIS